MGNLVKRATNHLRDPHLVRRIQEAFGVKQNLAPNESECADTANGTINVISNGGPIVTGGTIEWLASKTKVRHRLRLSSSSSSPESIPFSPDVKHAPDLPGITVESIRILDIFFQIVAACGCEPFYITVIPFLVWNIDIMMSRQVIFIWCLSMYVGQVCKQLFKWKRPSCPPALRLENNPKLETEYGFPSIHAIGSTTMPFYYLYRSYTAKTSVLF